MNRLFRWGILIALVVLVGSGLVAIKLIFVEDKDVTVPPLVGLQFIEAADKLQSLGLSARLDQVNSEQPQGTVVAQDIPEGTSIARGGIVNLKSSRGGTMIQVPDVRGMEFAEGVKALDTAGLKIGSVLRVPDQLKPAGTIIAQNPASPAGVISSRMVELLVSEGEAGRAETVQVPDLKGQDESLARQIVKQSDLSVSRVEYLETNLFPAGSVVRTQPRAGARVQFGASLVLSVAKTPTVSAGGDAAPGGSSGSAGVIETTPQPRQEQIPDVRPVDDTGMAPQGGTTVPVIPEPPVPPPPLVPLYQPVQATGKTAKIRYQVPPLSRSLPLKIEIADDLGRRVLKEQQTNGGEYLTIDAPYSGNANVTVQLGGELVWQERYD
ncbi:MAG: PASTA domain-containing protein [Synergistaceae bacterium]|nr:PASTA domain-containing protein [Synergistaceae bacterium]